MPPFVSADIGWRGGTLCTASLVSRGADVSWECVGRVYCCVEFPSTIQHQFRTQKSECHKKSCTVEQNSTTNRRSPRHPHYMVRDSPPARDRQAGQGLSPSGAPQSVNPGSTVRNPTGLPLVSHVQNSLLRGTKQIKMGFFAFA